MKLPKQWYTFIKLFNEKFDTEFVYENVHVFQDEDSIIERFTTHEFEEYLPNYIPIADDSGGSVAVISIHEDNTNVYLTSYGTLIEKDLKILDRNLTHWMLQKFPFERNESVINDKNSVFEIQQQVLIDKINKHPDLVNYFTTNYYFENLSLPENYPTIDNILDFQDGYRYNSVNEASLISDKQGDFKDSWLVIATNYFADPFIINLDEVDLNFPVYFAMHGAGKWELQQISNNINIFQDTLKVIYENRFDRDFLVSYFEKLSKNNIEFWDEVYKNALNLPDLTNEEQEVKIFQTDWREAEIYITDIGPNKMKIVSLLKKVHNLSGTEALKMSKQNRIYFSKVYFKYIDKTVEQLQNLGAKVEIEML